MKNPKENKKSIFLFYKLFLFLTVFLFHQVIYGQVNIIMNHNDFNRTGWNSAEHILNTKTVTGGNFGKILSREVDDQIYAQPLVLSNFRIAGANRNIVIVATVKNTLYVFDGDDAEMSTPYWKLDLTHDPSNFRPVRNTDMTGACPFLPQGYSDFSGNMGIVGTPAIDTLTKTLYVVARSKSKKEEKYVQYLHAIDLTRGTEKPGSPILIQASYPGTGDGNVNGILTFDPQKQNQRAGLLLHKGVVYICWASHCGWAPYHGWMIGYDASTLKQRYVYNTTPNGRGAGIWMSGQAPSVDKDGNILLTTGNGTTGQNGNPNDTINRGSSLLKLSPELKVLDFFTPANYDYLNKADRDYGVNGPLIIPDTHFSLSGSKDGGPYLVDNNDMGGTRSRSEDVLQRLNFADWGAPNTKALFGSPVYFKDHLNNEYIYGWAQGADLKQIPLNRETMRFDTLNSKTGITTSASGYMPGAILSLSSNGSNEGTGILWASHPAAGNANNSVVPGFLQAFDATDVSRELWNSNWDSKRDSVGKFAKFVPPTIANGKVYLATFSNKLNVYGLNPPASSPCSSSLPSDWRSADIGYVAYPGDVCVENGIYKISASGSDIWNKADAFHFLFQELISNETELTIRIASLKNTDEGAKTGIMVRKNLAPGSPFIFLGRTPTGRIMMSQRSLQNNEATNTKNIASLPNNAKWLKLKKSGNKFFGYYSRNGNDWNLLDSITLAFGPNSYLGLAYTTNNNSLLDTAVIDQITLKSDDIPAPNILDFQGRNRDNKHTYLTWNIADRRNSDYIEIQRSVGNTDFVTIGKILINGTNSEENTFTDYLPYDDNNYYRLKHVDKNGKASYSSTVHVRFKLQSVIVFPNPARDKVFIRNSDTFSYGKKISLQLVDFSGRIVHREDIETYGIDINTILIPKNLQSGMYVLIVSNSKGETKTEKIVITR